MPKIFGNQLTKTEILKRVGDISQIAGAIRYTYSEGKAKGTNAIEVKTGAGLRFVILPDRGMDIAYAEVNGIPFSYISKTGVISPVHYDEKDFLRSFTGGLLTTCGLTYMGAPCVDEGVSLGAHGRISNTPAFDVSINQDWDENGDYVIEVVGKVRESSMFGDNLVLKRTITAFLGENKIYLHDEIENAGFNKSPLMVLYHMNFGYPLLSENSVLNTNCINMRPRDDDATRGVYKTTEFSAPVKDYKEQVFYRDSVESSYVTLTNPDLGAMVKLEFSAEQLPYFVEWKQVGEQDYVVGLEPATNPPDGRAAIRARNELNFLDPMQKRDFDIILSFEACDVSSVHAKG